MSQGKDLLFYISSDGTDAGTATEVELQSDLTINPGKSLNATVYKNGEEATVNRGGWSAQFQMGNSAPLATGEALIWGLHDSEAVSYFWVKNANTGGIEFEGACRVVISNMNSPTSNDNQVTVNVGAVGAPTRGVAA
jgi:hypothetical protein